MRLNLDLQAISLQTSSNKNTLAQTRTFIDETERFALAIVYKRWPGRAVAAHKKLLRECIEHHHHIKNLALTTILLRCSR